MKLKHALIFGILTLSSSLFGQKIGDGIIYEDGVVRENFIEEYFEGGYEGYTNFFRENLTFPNSSYKNQTEGLLLVGFSINGARKTLRPKFLTLLDEEIQEQVQSALVKSILKWKMTDDKDYTIYQPIVYSMLPYYAETLDGDIPEIPADLPLKFMPPFILIKSKRIPDKLTVETLGDIEASETKKSFYLRAEDAYQKFLEKGDKESAYLVLNRIIRYNPLNRDYLLNRIKLEQAVGVNKYQVYDSYLLSDFVDSEANSYKGRAEKNTFVGFSASDRVIDSIANSNLKRQVYENYWGGMNTFGYDFISRITYPRLSQARGTKGISLSQFTIPPQGDVTFSMLTYLDDDIENEMKYAAESTLGNWIRRDTTYQVFVSATFSDFQFFDIAFDEKDEAYQKVRFSDDLLSVKLANPVELVDINLAGMTLEEAAAAVSAESEKQEALNDSLSQVTNYEVYNQYLANQEEYRTLIASGKSKKAFKVLSDMIRYNPFERFLIEERIRLAKEIKRDKYLAYDEKCLEALKVLSGSADERLDEIKSGNN